MRVGLIEGSGERGGGEGREGKLEQIQLVCWCSDGSQEGVSIGVDTSDKGQ